MTITTSNGVSKVIYQGFVITQLDEAQLESLRADIWLALTELAILKDGICSMCESYDIDIKNRVCVDCSIGCEMTDAEYTTLERVR